MTYRRFAALAFAALVFGALLAPVDAAAQTIWDRIRDRSEQDRNQRRDDDYGRRRGGDISDHERRVLRDASRRINDRGRSFQRNLDRLLDSSRYDNTRREDHINDDVRRFRDAAERFKNRAGDSNDLNRSSNEARQLLDSAAHVSRLLRRVRLDSRTSSDWLQIRNDLRTVSDIYGFRFRGEDYDDGYSGNDDWRRDRRRDDDRRW